MRIFCRQLILIPLLAAMFSCGGKSSGVVPDGDTLRLSDARLLTMAEYPEGYTLVTVKSPWDSTAVMARYALVDRDSTMPELPGGTVAVRVPLRSAVVFPEPHTSLLAALGAADAITGVGERRFVSHPAVTARIDAGLVAECGSDMSPNVEKILRLAPDAVLLSPYEGSPSTGKLAGMGIASILCADYLEATPLGRAEWMRFFGRLVGKGAEADSLYAVTAAEYGRLCEVVASAPDKPKVLFDKPYNGVWYVAGPRSVTGQLITDAGGENPFAYIDRTGSAALSAEEVLARGHDADIWLLRYNAPVDLTRAGLADENKLFTQFDAWTGGRVYGCNTDRLDLFGTLAFSPQDVLGAMVSVIHPELSDSTVKNRFFCPLP